MRKRRDLGQQLGRHGLTGDQELDRLEPRRERRVDEIFALGEEQPELVAPVARMQLADELQLRVRSGLDQVARANFACSAIAANASGSETARSASTLRSSPISAFRQPAMN